MTEADRIRTFSAGRGRDRVARRRGMRCRGVVLAVQAIAFLTGYAVSPAGANAADTTRITRPGPSKGGAAAPARDGNIAILEEYMSASERNTVAAYRLFVDRHPDHPLADRARQRLELLTPDE